MTNMYLAYFTNQYPTVSHSFIRREIITLQEMGNTVERFALRSDGAELVNPLNHGEFNKTSYASSEPKITIILAIFNAALKQPLKFLKTLLLAVKLGLRSDRGVLRNLAYLLESCVILKWQSEKTEHIHVHFGTNSASVVKFSRLLGGASL